MLAHKVVIIVIVIAIAIAAIYQALTMARYSSKCILSFNPPNSPMSEHFDCPDFIDEETEAYRG